MEQKSVNKDYSSGINDRILFKKFLGLSLDSPPPHRAVGPMGRRDAMIQLNSIVLQEFAKRGLSINEGIDSVPYGPTPRRAVDARLVKSASRPMSNDGLKDFKEKRNSPEGKLDKNGNPMKFSRDLESDWTVKNDKPHYGLKEHASVDVDNGFVLATTLTPASLHDTNYLPYLALASCHTEDPIGKIYADKGYYGEPNRSFLHLNDIKDGIMRKDTKTAKLTEIEIERNKKISKKRYIRFQPGGLPGRRVEQYFGLSHLHDGAYKARFTTIVKNTWDAMCRQTCPVKCEAYFTGVAFNLFRGSKLLAKA
jgi:IS5 family transposase